MAFNDMINPDDDELDYQIVKDLHRTGCSSFSGLDNDQERAVLKRVLLAYARWNKDVGYCQGEFHDQGDAKWIVIRLQLRGHNDMPCGRPFHA
jgi:hypothetical protein